MLIVGITGKLGAGKGTVSEYLIKKGFGHYSVGGYLTEKLIEQELEPNRDNMRLLANELRKKYGPSYITDKLADQARLSGKNSIIESIRNPGEAKSLKGAGNFILLGVTADPEVRYRRIRKRGEVKDKVSFKKFTEQEEMESDSKDSTSQNLNGCLKIADVVLDNNGTTKQLYSQIDRVFKKYDQN